MIHLIPPGEESLHIESADCECNPEFEIDEESGEMIYTHLPLDIDIEIMPKFEVMGQVSELLSKQDADRLAQQYYADPVLKEFAQKISQAITLAPVKIICYSDSSAAEVIMDEAWQVQIDALKDRRDEYIKDTYPQIRFNYP